MMVNAGTLRPAEPQLYCIRVGLGYCLHGMARRFAGGRRKLTR